MEDVPDAPLAVDDAYSVEPGQTLIAGSLGGVDPTPIDETLVPAGSTWKYLDNGSDQGSAWRAAGFNDAAWDSGRAQLGYGDSDEATVVADSRGTGSMTVYFRHAFNVDDPASVLSLDLGLVRDDGAAVYLNGRSRPYSQFSQQTASEPTGCRLRNLSII